MHQSKLILFTSLLLVSTLTHAETDNHSSNKEGIGIGFGIGALIGGLIAGPPGVVIGATAGSMFGHQEIGNQKIRKNDAYESFKKQVPVNDYEGIRSYIEKIIDGEFVMDQSERQTIIENYSEDALASNLRDLINNG